MYRGVILIYLPVLLVHVGEFYSYHCVKWNFFFFFWGGGWDLGCHNSSRMEVKNLCYKATVHHKGLFLSWIKPIEAISVWACRAISAMQKLGPLSCWPWYLRHRHTLKQLISQSPTGVGHSLQTPERMCLPATLPHGLGTERPESRIPADWRH